MTIFYTVAGGILDSKKIHKKCVNNINGLTLSCEDDQIITHILNYPTINRNTK